MPSLTCVHRGSSGRTVKVLADINVNKAVVAMELP